MDLNNKILLITILLVAGVDSAAQDFNDQSRKGAELKLISRRQVAGFFLEVYRNSCEQKPAIVYTCFTCHCGLAFGKLEHIRCHTCLPDF